MINMSIIRTRTSRLNLKSLIKRFSTVSPQQDHEYTPTPNYPPILDLSIEKRRERKKQAEHDAVKEVKTVEEKQIKLNMPRFYGFKCFVLKEDVAPYNGLPLVQHVTRTHIIEQDGLPEYYRSLNVDELYEKVKSDVEEVLLYEYNAVRRKHDVLETELKPDERENFISSAAVRQINRVILNNLSESVEHLKTAQLDYDPRIETFWFAGGMDPPMAIQKCRQGLPFLKDSVNEPVDRAMQYRGQPSISLRHRLPLSPVVPQAEGENTNYEVPLFKYDPRVVETFWEYIHGANIPGYWPGDPHQFGLLSYHKRGHMLNRGLDHVPDQEVKEALQRQAILASFGWLSAQANFLGFTTFNDITYPMVTQTIITDGRSWNFYVYQMNTMLVHSKHTSENPLRNLCWASKDYKLFEEVQSGRVVGFNDETLKNLIIFYANAPQERLGVNLRPYLSKEAQYSADYEDDDKRNWLEREYKFLVSNRPRFKLPYEIYAWEKIYKIDNKTRPMDKKLRPFELHQRVWDRRLDARQPNYIPRALRPHLPRHKGRYAKEYFP